MWYSQTGVKLSVKFTDVKAAAAVLSGGEAELMRRYDSEAGWKCSLRSG